MAARRPRPAGKLAVHDLRDYADQQASHGYVAGGRHGRNTSHARAVGYSPCRAKCSRRHGNPDLSVGPTVKVLFSAPSQRKATDAPPARIVDFATSRPEKNRRASSIHPDRRSRHGHDRPAVDAQYLARPTKTIRAVQANGSDGIGLRQVLDRLTSCFPHDCRCSAATFVLIIAEPNGRGDPVAQRARKLPLPPPS